MSPVWVRELKKKLKDAKKICILGIGNRSRGDDGVGPIVISALSPLLKRLGIKKILLIDCGEVPENYTGVIRRFNPTHTIIIDSCLKEKRPGSIFILKKEKILENGLSTHRMSIGMLVRFIEETIGSRVFIIGVEPKSLSLGQGLSKPVQRAMEVIIKEMTRLINNREIA